MRLFHDYLTPIDFSAFFCQRVAPDSINSEINKEIARIRQIVSPDG